MEVAYEYIKLYSEYGNSFLWIEAAFNYSQKHTLTNSCDILNIFLSVGIYLCLYWLVWAVSLHTWCTAPHIFFRLFFRILNHALFSWVRQSVQCKNNVKVWFQKSCCPMIDTCQYTRDLPDLSGKQSMVNIHEWLFLKREREKNCYMGRTYFSPEKWSAIGSMDLRSSRLNAPV